jgi:hypothetical protein
MPDPPSRRGPVPIPYTARATRQLGPVETVPVMPGVTPVIPRLPSVRQMHVHQSGHLLYQVNVIYRY